MPIIKSTYKPPFYLRQMDLVTIYTAKFRHVQKVKYTRERIELSDGDFLDIDWSLCGTDTRKCILLLHGLEGSSHSQYSQGLAAKFNKGNYDVCAINFRGCSGEPNRTYGCYHSGKTEDIQFVLERVLSKNVYSHIILHGVSLGANIALKLVGEMPNLPQEIKATIAVSAPCDLDGSANQLLKGRNILYAHNFIKQLKAKVKFKQKQFPSKITIEEIDSINNIRDFDDVYTAPAHGFIDAKDYYQKCSSLQFLHEIHIPTLILNAQNDSFLSKDSYPYHVAKTNRNLYLETPKYGGHVAFYQGQESTYNEDRAFAFAESCIP